MKKMKFNTIVARTVAAGCLIGLFFGAQAVSACTVDNWSADSGNVVAGGRVADNVQRYSGLCGMQAADGVVSYVQDNSPGGIARIVSRFYVLNNLQAGETAVIYRGYETTSTTGPLFTVTMSDTGQVTLRDEATGSTVTQGAINKWAEILVDWTQGSGTGAISLSVSGQGQQTVNSLNNAGVALQSVRLGNLDGSAGSLNFDAYESRRTTLPDTLMIGDVNGSGTITSADVVAARLEFLGTEQPGQPDCNESGSISSADVVCTRLEFLNAP